jgi:tetratricopeptide (TPR) repeat protein
VKNLIHEIHRRSIWQVLGIYLAASWMVLQVVEVVTGTAGLPDWTPGMAFVLLLIGLPIVAGTAFVQGGMPGRSESGSDAPEDDAGSEGPPEKGLHDEGPATHRVDPALEFSTITPIRGMLTWRNAILGGIGAFALLGFTLVAYFVLWTTGLGPQGSLVAQGVFEEGERIVLADFEDDTGVGLGDVTTDAIRVDLQESTVIHLAAPAYVGAVLERMGRSSDDVFTAGLARELAQREGLKAVIQGEVSAVGSGYLLTASLVAAETGDVLRAFRVPVSSEDDLLAGIDKLSQDIREKAGESLRDIRAGRPLEEVTTSSLEALRLLSTSEQLRLSGQEIESIPLLERALELDPQFAMAWRALSVVMWNTGTDGQRMEEAGTRAFELRERLTDREGMLADAWYRFAVERDPEAALSAYARMLERYPDDETALNNTGVHAIQLGRWSAALEPLERATQLPTPTDNSLGNLTFVQWALGQKEAAWATLARQESLYPEGLALRYRHWLLGGERRFEEAIEMARRELATILGETTVQVQGRRDLAAYHLGLGRYGEALEILEDAQRIAEERGTPELHVGSSALLRVWTAWVLEGDRAAAEALDEALPVEMHDELTLVNAGGFILAAMVMGDRAEEAESVFRAWEAGIPTERRGMVHRQLGTLLAAWSARVEGDAEEAARQFDILFSEVQACGDFCYFWAERARLAEELGDDERAIDFYERHLNNTPLFWTTLMTPWDPVAYERLGALYAERGDAELARARLETLVATFENGDGPYVAFVERARAKLDELR